MNSPLPSRLVAAMLFFSLQLPAHAKSFIDEDISDLMNVNITGASGFVQKANEAPSTITVITAKEIRDYGWTTLAQALNSVRGVQTSTDRSSVGSSVRGLAPNIGAINARLLILVDQQKTNDNVMDMGALGSEFPLSLDMVDHIEIIRGPAATVYGSNALFGVVNLVTRKGADIKGTEWSVSQGSWSTNATTASFGRVFDNGGDLIVSKTFFGSKGQDLYYKDFDMSQYNNGWSRGTDGERGEKFFAKYLQGGFRMQGMLASKKKVLPGVANSTEFGNPGTRYSFDNGYFNANYSEFVADKLELSGKLYGGLLDFMATGIFPNGFNTRWKIKGRWLGTELRLVSTRWDRHHVSLGFDWQDNKRQDDEFAAFVTATGMPATAPLGSRNNSLKWGVTLQDDFVITSDWRASLGVRADKSTTLATRFSPRLGLIFNPFPEGTLKLLYGEAFRAPNVVESYRDPSVNLKPETIKNGEIAWEQYFATGTRLTLGAYVYRIHGLLGYDQTQAHWITNRPDVFPGKGLEIEVEQKFMTGAMLRTSFARQLMFISSPDMLNTGPASLFKVNYATPLWSPDWRAGVEVQYTGRQATLVDRTFNYGHLGSSTIANLNLIWKPLPDTEISLLIRNLFNRNYGGVYPYYSPSGVIIPTVPQDGRNFTLKLVQRF